MAINEVYFGDTQLISLKDDTVATANDIMAGKIGHLNSGNIVTGTATNDATIVIGNNNTSSHLLSSETAYANGNKITGTMVNRGSGTAALATKNATYNISEGYYNGTGNITIASSAIADCISENIKNGSTILGVNGSFPDYTTFNLACEKTIVTNVTTSSSNSATLTIPAVNIDISNLTFLLVYTAGININLTSNTLSSYYVHDFVYTKNRILHSSRRYLIHSVSLTRGSSSSKLSSSIFSTMDDGYYATINNINLLKTGGTTIVLNRDNAHKGWWKASTDYYIIVGGY